jgi:hypothetical protein
MQSTPGGLRVLAGNARVFSESCGRILASRTEHRIETIEHMIVV